MDKNFIVLYTVIILLLIMYSMYGIYIKELCLTYGFVSLTIISLLIVWYINRNNTPEQSRRNLIIVFMIASILVITGGIIYKNKHNIQNKSLLTGIIGISVMGFLLLLGKKTGDHPQPPPPPPPKNKYKINKPNTLSTADQTTVDKLLQTLYPLYKTDTPSQDFWKTLDFFYSAGNLVQGSFASNQSSGIGYPNSSNMSPITKTILNSFRLGITSNKHALDDNFNRLPHTSYSAELLDIISYPFTGAEETNSVDGYFVNRFNPDDLFGKNIGFCRTGTHDAEFAVVDNVKGISAYYIGIRGTDGEIMGFKNNEPIEFVHVYTHHNPSKIGEQFFDTMYAGFGDYLYYARGSGIFINPGKVLNARNKIDAMRVALHHSKMTPTVKGWNDSDNAPRGDQSKDKNKYYQKCPNTFIGFLNLVNMWGTDKEIKLINDGSDYTMPSRAYPDFIDDQKPLSCTEGYTYGGNVGFWCPGNPIAMQYFCCSDKNNKDVCKDGKSSGTFQSGSDKLCELTTSVGSDVSWRMLAKLVPPKLPDNTELNTDENKLAWLLYVSCNGINKTSGMFANPWIPDQTLNTKQISLLTQMVAWLGNVGGIGDDAYIVPMKYTALDNNGKRLFDTCIMAGQPEASGCLATEIMTLQYDNTARPFSTVHPEKGNVTKCNYLINPGFSGDYDKTGQPCKDAVKDCQSSSGIFGVCVSDGSNTTCQPPSILSCDNVSWAAPILSYPVWPKGKKAPFDITENNPPPSMHCDVDPSNRSDCGKDLQAHTFPGSCTQRGCCFKNEIPGPWCYCPEGKTFDEQSKTCK